MLLAPCTLLLLMSCHSAQDETIVPEGQCTITFSVTNYRQISFDDLSSSAVTRSVPTDHPSTLAHLLMAVFDAETGQQVLSPILRDYVDYENKPSEYPQFSVTLPYGHYRVLVLGYNGSRACNITSLNHISWAENYVPNTFLYCGELTLDKDSEPSKEITLKHVVAAFRLMTEDDAPTNIKKMRFISTAGGTVLDATTGFSPQSTGRTSDVTVQEKYIGKPYTIIVYLFLPEEQSTTNYTVQAIGDSNEVLYEKHFNNVPLRINYLTEWKGKFFEASDEEPDGEKKTFYIEWDTQWADTLHI